MNTTRLTRRRVATALLAITAFAPVVGTGCGRIGFSSVSGLEELDSGPSPNNGSTANQDGGSASGLVEPGVTNDGGPTGQARVEDARVPTDSGPAAANDAGPGGFDAGPGTVDAGQLDAGRPDVGQPDAGPGPTGCASYPSAIACEDFEGSPPTAPWQQTGVGSFARILAPSERGQYVGRFQTAPGSRAAFQRSVAPLRNGDDVYMRAFIRVDADSASSWNVLMQAETSAFTAKTSLDFTRNAELNAVRSGSAFVSASFPTRRWACIEAHFFLSNTAGRIDVSVDGSSVGQQTGLNTSVPSDGLTELFFGIIADAANQASLQVEYDDVVFSESPIGC